MDHNFLYDGLVGPDGPKHIWNEKGTCIRCGEDAEEWEAGCVEEIVDLYNKNTTILIGALEYLLADMKLQAVYGFSGELAEFPEVVRKHIENAASAIALAKEA